MSESRLEPATSTAIPCTPHTRALNCTAVLTHYVNISMGKCYLLEFSKHHIDLVIYISTFGRKIIIANICFYVIYLKSLA